MAILLFGRAVVRLKFTHHFIKNCALENAKLLHIVMNYGCSTLKRDEVTSKFSRLLMEVLAALQGKKFKKKKKRRKHFENVQIKSNILINHLHVLLSILIIWMFALCMMLEEYFTTSNAENMNNRIIHNRFL